MKKIRHIKLTRLLLVVTLLIVTIAFSKSISKHQKNNFKIVNNNEVSKIIINKNTTDKQFSKIINALNEKGIIAEFKNITRNEENEITAIDITITKDGSTSSYSANSNMAINKIIITIDGNYVAINNNGLMSFGFGSTHSNDNINKLLQKHGSIFSNLGNQNNIDELRKLMEQQSKLFQNFNFDDSENEDNGFGIFFAPRERHFYKDNDNATKDFDNDDDFNYEEKIQSTYIVNGKEMTKEAYEKMNKSDIHSLEIRREVVKSYKKKN